MCAAPIISVGNPATQSGHGESYAKAPLALHLRRPGARIILPFDSIATNAEFRLFRYESDSRQN